MKRGQSATELMISLAIFGTIIATFAPFLKRVLTGFSSHEARSSLTAAAEQAVNQIAVDVNQNKRLFGSADTSFLSALVLPTAAFTGSKLPVIQSTGTLSPNLAGYIGGDIGNSLLVLDLDPPVDLPNLLDSGGVAHTIRIDIYHFSYFYLVRGTGRGVGPQPQIQLRRWYSNTFADETEIAALTDATLQTNVVSALGSSGHARAINPSATTSLTAFYTISGSAIAPALGYSITQASSTIMLNILTGITGGGYHYGVSPNSGNTFQSPVTVPKFVDSAHATATFPSGFETAIVGPNSSRQILIRLVLAAQGSFGGIIAADDTTMVSARDVY